MNDEAAALLKNIQIRREILAATNGEIDIGINGTAVNHAAYNAAYDQYLLDGNIELAKSEVAEIFGDKEFSSVGREKGKIHIETITGMNMRKEKGVEIALLIAFCILPNLAVHASSIEGCPKDMVWHLLDEMAKKMPLSKESFGEIIGMEPWLDKAEERKTSWRFDPINLSEVLGIHDTSISLEKDGSFYAAGFDVAGACIHVRDVRKKYGPLEIVDTPKGHSLFDDTVYQSQQDWGSFYFIFLDIAPDCLSSVTISSRRDIGI